MSIQAYYIVLGLMVAAVAVSVAVRTRAKAPIAAIAVDTIYATLGASVVLVVLAVVMPRLG